MSATKPNAKTVYFGYDEDLYFVNFITTQKDEFGAFCNWSRNDCAWPLIKAIMKWKNEEQQSLFMQLSLPTVVSNYPLSGTYTLGTILDDNWHKKLFNAMRCSSYTHMNKVDLYKCRFGINFFKRVTDLDIKWNLKIDIDSAKAVLFDDLLLSICPSENVLTTPQRHKAKTDRFRDLQQLLNGPKTIGHSHILKLCDALNTYIINQINMAGEEDYLNTDSPENDIDGTGYWLRQKTDCGFMSDDFAALLRHWIF